MCTCIICNQNVSVFLPKCGHYLHKECIEKFTNSICIYCGEEYQSTSKDKTLDRINKVNIKRYKSKR
jgi:hypothetical protein